MDFEAFSQYATSMVDTMSRNVKTLVQYIVIVQLVCSKQSVLSVNSLARSSE